MPLASYSAILYLQIAKQIADHPAREDRFVGNIDRKVIDR